MSTFLLKDIENENDLILLRKGRCPWCTEKLTPLFEKRGGVDKHVADECLECGDRFE